MEYADGFDPHSGRTVYQTLSKIQFWLCGKGAGTLARGWPDHAGTAKTHNRNMQQYHILSCIFAH